MVASMKRKHFYQVLLVIILLVNVSCTTLIKGLTNDLAFGVYQQNDMKLVQEAAPAYLLILESMIYKNPGNRDYLMTGIQLYTSYATAFIKDEERSKLFNDKILKWGNELLASYPLYKKYNAISAQDREKKDIAFTKFIAGIKKADVPYVFWGMYSIGMDALKNSNSPAGLLLLPRLLAIADKIYQLDDTFFNGAPHLFFGLYYGSYPEAFGGSPVKAKAEFEKAIEISGGNMLAHKIMFAEVYYKSQYDRDGYEKLLKEVIDFNIDLHPELRLMNIMAKQQAYKLLEEIDDVFY